MNVCQEETVQVPEEKDQRRGGAAALAAAGGGKPRARSAPGEMALVKAPAAVAGDAVPKAVEKKRFRGLSTQPRAAAAAPA